MTFEEVSTYLDKHPKYALPTLSEVMDNKVQDVCYYLNEHGIIGKYSPILKEVITTSNLFKVTVVLQYSKEYTECIRQCESIIDLGEQSKTTQLLSKLLKFL